MTAPTIKRDEAWLKTEAMLTAADPKATAAVIVGLRRSRGRRPNADKTTALFETMAERVSDEMGGERHTSIKPFAMMQTCYVEGSVRWLLCLMNQPEIETATLNSSAPTVAGGRGKMLKERPRSTWFSVLGQG